MFTLIIEDKDGAIADEYSFEEGEFIVGRSHSSDIILPSDNVSRRHARLYTQGGRCYVEDLNSSNGVFVNGKRIHRVFEIVRSAQIKVGDYYLHVEGTSYSQAGGDVSRDVEIQEGAGHAADMGVSMDEPQIYGRLVGMNLSTQGKPFDIVKPVNLVGRGKDCAITIIDQSVSRIHAKVLRGQDGRLTVEDLRSSNGTYVNDDRVNKQAFGHGDRVRFGNVEFMCEMPGMGDVEVIEVSSGGRKGLIFLIVFLVLMLVGGGITVYLLRDRIWSDAPAGPTEEETEQAREDAEERKAEALKEQFNLARKDLEQIIKRARTLSTRDQWADAERELVKGARLLEKRGAIDKKGELSAYFSTEEDALRADRQLYEEFFDAFSEEEWAAAGRAYARLVKADGPHRLLAKSKVKPKKEQFVASGKLLCDNNALDKCLKLYQKAKALDPTDAEVGKQVGKIRILLSSQGGGDKAPE